MSQIQVPREAPNTAVDALTSIKICAETLGYFMDDVNCYLTQNALLVGSLALIRNAP